MLAKAHRAVADALVNGKAIRIEGGDYCLEGLDSCCPRCGQRLQAPSVVAATSLCKKCESKLSTSAN